MMTGLTPPTSGRATILGQPYRDLHNPGRQVGVMLDASAQHPGRTGREVLRVAAVSVGVARARVEEVLALVGLTDEEAGRRVRNYSLGMRQRLGIAAALLGEPQVLVLDEPANGLDPQGIHWMRGLLRRFADGGGTVLLSSHLLHEVQIVADDLVMIGRGRIVAMGSKDELLSRGGTTVSSTDDARLARLLEAADVPVTRTGSGLVVDAEAARGRRDRRRASPSSSSSCAPAARRAWRRCSSASRPPPRAKETQHEHRTAPAVGGTSRHAHRPPRPSGSAVRPHPAGRAAQDGRHPRRALDGHRDGRASPPSSWPASSSGGRPRTPPSAACWRSPRCR